MDVQRNRFYEFGPFRMDIRERLLLRNGEPVPLPPKVYDMLLALVENSGHVIEKEELMKAVWPDTFVEESNLTVNVSALRKALGEGASEHQYIETVPRRGYRFVSTVTPVKNESSDPSAKRRRNSDAIIEEKRKVEAGNERPGDDKGVSQPTRVSAPLPRRQSLSLRIVAVSALLTLLSVTAYYTSTKRVEHGFKVRSVAVLPFRTLVEDNRDQPLEIGMCDALITRLGGLNDVVVRPTSSVVMYNKLGQDPLAAGRELGVDALLDGYVQRSGGRIRVTAQLLRVADGKPLWSGQFNENFTDIFAVEDSISQQIVEALRLNLTGEQQRRLTRHYTENVEAYELYLKGRYFLNQRTVEGLKKSIVYFQQTIEKDPKYALAFAGLADSYSQLHIRADAPPQDSYEKAKTAALRALEIDDTIAEAHTSLAIVRYSYDWDWAGAESEFKRAIELNPNSATAHQSYASYLISTGRHEEAISETKRAQALDPLSLAIKVQAARILYFSGRYEEAIEQCHNALEMNPNYGMAHLFLGRSYKQKRMYEESLAELEKGRGLLGEDSEVLSQIGYTYAVSGRRGEAQKVLQELRRLSGQRYVSPYHIAVVYAGLGEKDDVFEWLEKAYERREARMNILKYAPEFDNLRSDRRYADLLKRVGLAP